NQANIEKNAIDSICISEGPGSYTGTRIAMTLAKTMGETLPCDVYTISTLRLYAANNPNTMVIMNARADRAYVGIFNNNDIIEDDYVSLVNEIDAKDYNVVGDGNLIGKADIYPNIAEAFLKTKPVWKKVEKIAFLVPKYLKESESYLK
ncbi:MAG: tRNA (adenosine(37)-N6)-threonylcarbamoyltransferase complex dimerization subunit type 1 TsaB, partial [Bacillota bacterium]|nr:tRNA (adenosine(37)-N6)-threonylcarbamoyltransferase complex dimerization subunit type 1 TsaB [Bacillota bacterium]